MHHPSVRSSLAFVASLALALLFVSTTAATAQEPARLGFDDLFAEGRGGIVPTQIAWLPDGSAVSYLYDDPDAGGGEALWRQGVPSGERRIVVRPGDLAGVGDDGAIDGYQWGADGRLVLEAAGDLYLWSPAANGDGSDDAAGTGRLRRLTATEAVEEAPRLSPDGSRLAYVREANLYLVDLTGDAEVAERALTTDGELGVTLNATTSWVYWEEIWNRDPQAYWWSPDGRRIVYYRFDETPVGRFPLVDELPPYAAVELQRYPKAGSANPRVRLGVLELASGETTWLATGEPDDLYLARVDWSPDGEAVAVQRLDREQTTLDLLVCGVDDGACRQVLRESHPTWVNLDNDFRWLADGRFVWGAARDGWRHLYLYSAGGELVRRLTAGAWSVTSVDGVLEAEGAGALIVTGHAEGPLGAAERRVYRVPLGGGGGGAEPLTEPGGWHAAQVAPAGGHWLHTWSDADHPGWRRIERLGRTAGGPGGGEVVAELPQRAPSFDPEALPAWRFFTLPGPDGVALPAARLEPAGSGADGADGADGEPRPAIMYHYGGPGSQVVVDRWDPRGRGLWHKLMAQRGFAVLMVDNQGSAFFGKAGEDRLHRRFGEVNLAAQTAGARYLAERPDVDGERIGLWGWSGGGTNTLYSVLNRPATWAAAVAGAPVTDWRYYDTIWTERYLDHPDDNPDGYRDSSPITYAERLAIPLLVVHGTADDNVHPQNTMALVEKLVDAGLPVETAIYPGQKHGFRGPASRHFYERMTEFFERWLQPGSARSGKPIASTP